MLQQRLGLSLPTQRKLGAWTPVDEPTLLAWFAKGVEVTDSGTPTFSVSEWKDQSSNANHLLQSNLTEQPVNGTGAAKGILTFDGSDDNFDFTSQISIAGEFTYGFKLQIGTVGRTLLADNDIVTGNEWMKTINSTTMRFKIGGVVVNLNLDAPKVWGDDYLVYTRDGAGLISCWQNGVLQTATPTLAGTVEIDNFGVRKTGLNPYEGTISEIQIYSGSSDEITANVNARLASL